MSPAKSEATRQVVQKKLQVQLQAWREDLLSIDRRQKLVYFSHPKSGSFEFVEPGVVEVERLVRSGDVHLISAEPESEDTESTLDLGLPKISSNRILRIAGKTDQLIMSACRRLHQRSEQEFADRGVWILYVGLGMLNWIDPDDGRKVSSPLLLIPVRLTKANARYVLSQTESEPLLNAALALKMSRDLGVQLPELDDEELSIVEVLAKVRQAISVQPGWTVSERSILMPFTFHKEAMYRDLEQNETEILGNELVQLLALGPEAPAAGNFSYEPPSDDDLDSIVPPDTLHSILDADGSQRKCILAARDGQSFVMDGPPGTGKSQTIANIIAELMALGKSVLFVSEKAAALDVVRDRLSSRHLAPFLLELHSHKATRKQVVETLHEELKKRPAAKSRFGSVERRSLEDSRAQLTAYAQAMNEMRRPLGRTLHDVIGRLSQLTNAQKYPPGNPKLLMDLDAERLAHILFTAKQLADVWEPAEQGEGYLWRGLSSSSMSMDDVREASRRARRASTAARDLAAAVSLFDSALPFLDMQLNERDVERRRLISKSLSNTRSVPSSWWTLPDLQPATQRAGLLRKLSVERSEARSAISASLGNGWRFDDAGMGLALRTFVEKDPGIFRGSLVDMTITELGAVEADLGKVVEAFDVFQARAGELGRLFLVDVESLTISQVETLVALARLSQQGPLPEAQWLNPSVQGPLDESVRVLSSLTAIVQDRAESLASVFKPEVLSLDLVSLIARFDERRGFKKWSRQAREDKRIIAGVAHSGVASKEVIAALRDALLWQQAQAELDEGAAEYSPRLGSYYAGTRTDFGRISAAIHTAREALRLAGGKVTTDALRRQLSRQGAPDSKLLPLADSIVASIDALRAAWSQLLDPEVKGKFADLPLATVRTDLQNALDDCAASTQERSRLSNLGCDNKPLKRCLDSLAAIDALQRLEDGVAEVSSEDRSLFGESYRGFDTDWDELDTDLAWCEQARSRLGAPLDAEGVNFLLEFRPMDVPLDSGAEFWLGSKKLLLDFFSETRGAELARNFANDLALAADVLEEMADTASPDIDVWLEFERLKSEAVNSGLDATVSDLEGRAAPRDDVGPALERAALAPWAEAVISSDERLRTYRADARANLVQSFRDLDERLVQDAFSSVVEACAARRPRSNHGPAAIIANEANRKTRHKPIRRLLSETSTLSQALKPCFMMSPLSVSQFLPPEIRFDVVIFDEASQVTPADAVNCIYRGRQLIVAGDQKQLPPTSFFTVADSDEDEDEEAPDDFDSVLDICKGAGVLPSLPLTWHYRSRHEDLITYSNYRFYDGKLNTFPGAVHEAGDLGVHFEFVNGVYRRGGQRDNPIEAEKVVDRILAHRSSNPGLSLGVVTFSQTQAEAISLAIERRAETEPLLRGLMEDHDRLQGFFVKNLESVQGDERDVIIFSIGYGPDENGKLTMGFGPLTKKGGQRRLNVAITRAKQRVEVVSSFRAGNMTETGSEGNRHLRNYLDYAERGHAALAEDLSGAQGDVESPFEEEVVAVIRSWGYQAVPQVGTAGYRIDIGVPHPDLPGRFVLGVECDGAAYHSTKTARDRDRLRESVLRGLGWNIYRIWGISWYRDRTDQEQRLKAAIETAVRDHGRKLQPTSYQENADVSYELDFHEVDLEAAPEWTVPYTEYVQRPQTYRHLPGNENALPDLIEYCSAVLAIEAPLHIETLSERVKRDWGVRRAGSNIDANIRRAVGISKVNGMRASLDKDGFARIPPLGSVKVRVPVNEAGLRKVGAVPPEEIEEAAVRIIQDAVSATDEQVVLAVRRIFGWGRSGSDIQAAVQKALFRAVKAGRCRRGDSGSYTV